jgi:cobalamin biosynthesis Mg chelatase CobN
MKSIAILLLAVAALGLVAVADAQTSNPSGSASGSVSTPSGSASGSVSGPSGSASGSSSSTPSTPSTGAPAATPERPSASAPAPRSSGSDDGAAALPRTSVSERTTIFGLSPTAAVVIAAALLVVVILAIVAMTRSNDTYIDTNRRV